KQGPRLLADWGLLEKVVATNCPPVVTQLTDFGDFPLIGRDIQVGNIGWGYGPRRRQLDHVLVEAAFGAGVWFRSSFLGEGFLWDGDQIHGIRGRDRRERASMTEKARITVGADGRNSLLARVAGARAYEETPALTCWYFSYWSGVATEGFELYVRDRRAIF